MSIKEKVALSDEQFGFLVRAIRNAPVDQLRATLRNIRTQIVSFDVTEFELLDSVLPTLALRLPEQISQTAADTRLAEGRLDLEGISVAHTLVVAAALLHLSIASVRTWRGQGAVAQKRGLAVFVLVLVLGVLWNAGIYGALSEPHDRYQSRVIWLIPLASLVVIFLARRPSASPYRAVIDAKPETPK